MNTFLLVLNQLKKFNIKRKVQDELCGSMCMRVILNIAGVKKCNWISQFYCEKGLKSILLAFFVIFMIKNSHQEIKETLTKPYMALEFINFQ